MLKKNEGDVFEGIFKLFSHSRNNNLFYATGTNFIETELTQCLRFFGVRYSPSNTWPKCAPQLAQTISTRRPSASGTRFTAPGISSSKLGQPQCDSNFDSEV